MKSDILRELLDLQVDNLRLPSTIQIEVMYRSRNTGAQN